MTIHGKIRDEKIQYNSNSKAAKISTSNKFVKQESITAGEAPDQSSVTEQANFTHYTLRKN